MFCLRNKNILFWYALLTKGLDATRVQLEGSEQQIYWDIHSQTVNIQMRHTHYHNSNLIWRTVSCLVGEVIPPDHPRRVESRVIQWYGLIHET